MEWLIVTAVVIIASLAACILWAVQLSKRKFQCGACNKEFNVKWNKLLFAIHSYDHYNIRCPYCNNKGCTEKQKD
ncbi:MAG: hypothetical protein IKO27_05415 [Ruminococcus sp.]|nr:hypothetical protein [Ruminococcus sp.]